ncbi:MAG: CocE/NonD family hydrolase [Janthinobacterium lividum]
MSSHSMRFVTALCMPALCVFGTATLPIHVHAAAQHSAAAAKAYVRSEAMVPMRDGVKLHLVIVRPQGSETGAPLPILMSRTPYGAKGSSESVSQSKPELAASGYIFVFGDIRGKYGSEGQFVMNRPLVHKPGDRIDPKLVDESSDTYDTVEWMLKNLPNNNGRVGVLGVSYPGFLAMMAGIDHHPAVKAISPQAPMTDIWMGDDFFHNGAFRETYGYDYVLQLERAKDDQTVSMPGDAFDYFLQHVNFAGAAADAKMTELPTAKRFLAEPEYSPFWQAMAVEKHLHRPEVPTLEVGGWWDQEDMWGTQEEYSKLRSQEAANDPQHRVYLALGPWNHGGWNSQASKLGAIDFGEPTGVEYRKSMEAPFFELYLKDRPGFKLEDTASFRTGSNQWQYYAQWPPKAGFHPAKLYLGAKQTLSFTAPVATFETKYTADPANPIPYRERPVQSTYGKDSRWRTWLVSDQRFVSKRPDQASFTSPVLDRDTTVTGDIVADIFASTSGTDGDWIVKLIDVYPEDAPGGMGGYQLMIVDEIFRGRYRKSFEKPEPIKAGAVEEYKWSLHGADHTFLKGHRMLVQVQSSWFPLYDRNPQTFVPNIMTAPADSYKAETITVYSSPKYPSHLDVLQPDNEQKADLK